MKISFVILTWNSEKYIAKCLYALLEDLKKSEISNEIFVVDNGSIDKTVPILKSFKDKFPKQMIPIYLDKNKGTTYSRNIALKEAKGNYISVIDSDVEVSTGTIKGLINTLNQNKKAGIVAPRIIYPNGRYQKSVDSFPTVFTKLNRYVFLKRNENDYSQRIKTSQEVDYAISAIWVIKRDVLDEVGLLDENIFYAPEDVDYCLRVWMAGYSILYNPAITVVHHAQEISRGVPLKRPQLSHLKGLCYYFLKHKYVFRKPKLEIR